MAKDLFRSNFILFMLGHNRTGKSVVAKDLAISYRKKFGKKKNIIAYDPQSRFKDITDSNIMSEKWEEYFDESGEKLLINDTLFILDDYRGLMTRDTLDPFFLKMLMLRNEYGLDFIFVIHSPKLIIERISYYITHFALFYTSGDANAFKKADKVQSIETISQCRDFVNKYVKANGRGEYKDRSFPYAFIDTENEKIQLINFDKAEVNGKVINYKNKENEVKEVSVG